MARVHVQLNSLALLRTDDPLDKTLTPNVSEDGIAATAVCSFEHPHLPNDDTVLWDMVGKKEASREGISKAWRNVHPKDANPGDQQEPSVYFKSSRTWFQQSTKDLTLAECDMSFLVGSFINIRVYWGKSLTRQDDQEITNQLIGVCRIPLRRVLYGHDLLTTREIALSGPSTALFQSAQVSLEVHATEPLVRYVAAGTVVSLRDCVLEEPPKKWAQNLLDHVSSSGQEVSLSPNTVEEAEALEKLVQSHVDWKVSCNVELPSYTSEQKLEVHNLKLRFHHVAETRKVRVASLEDDAEQKSGGESKAEGKEGGEDVFTTEVSIRTWWDVGGDDDNRCAVFLEKGSSANLLRAIQRGEHAQACLSFWEPEAPEEVPMEEKKDEKKPKGKKTNTQQQATPTQVVDPSKMECTNSCVVHIDLSDLLAEGEDCMNAREPFPYHPSMSTIGWKATHEETKHAEEGKTMEDYFNERASDRPTEEIHAPRVSVVVSTSPPLRRRTIARDFDEEGISGRDYSAIAALMCSAERELDNEIENIVSRVQGLCREQDSAGSPATDQEMTELIQQHDPAVVSRIKCLVIRHVQENFRTSKDGRDLSSEQVQGIASKVHAHVMSRIEQIVAVEVTRLMNPDEAKEGAGACTDEQDLGKLLQVAKDCELTGWIVRANTAWLDVLARVVDPEKKVELWKEYGKFCSRHKRYDEACASFQEAGVLLESMPIDGSLRQLGAEVYLCQGMVQLEQEETDMAIHTLMLGVPLMSIKLEPYYRATLYSIYEQRSTMPKVAQLPKTLDESTAVSFQSVAAMALDLQLPKFAQVALSLAVRLGAKLGSVPKFTMCTDLLWARSKLSEGKVEAALTIISRMEDTYAQDVMLENLWLQADFCNTFADIYIAMGREGCAKSRKWLAVALSAVRDAEEGDHALTSISRCKSLYPNVAFKFGKQSSLDGEVRAARAVFLNATRHPQTCLSTWAWTGLGEACYRTGESAFATKTLEKSLTLDQANPITWGLLSLVLLYEELADDVVLSQASKAFYNSLRFGMNDEELLSELVTGFEKHQGMKEEATLARKRVWLIKDSAKKKSSWKLQWDM